MSDKSYKILAFDFDTKVLDEIYYKGNYRNSYNEFRQFLKENKFDKHPQGSFYISSVKMDEIKVELIIKKARKTFDWFKYGVKDMRIANLESPEFSNLTHIAQNGKNEKEYDELVRKTQEARRQKQLEALKNFKIDNKQIIQSKDKER
ncbi:MAG: hypothetical protein SPE49_04105 [Campylobacter sp.]|uniref:hypothetical protein n=2 Tax=Campylobacter sp. TaxID=205 RepID=UPI002A7F854E|nr:hypothetical protein [Campylobacter sp.]MDY5115138.1 hypothetical protein [Campylobacter sp.]